MKTIVIGALLALAFAAGAHARERTALDKYLDFNDLELPNAVNYGEFESACVKRGMLGLAAFLESVNVEVQGEGDGSYLLRADLLRACGDECNPREGLGEVLADIAVYRISNR